MELVSLHPFDPAVARSYVQALLGQQAPPPEWSAWWSPRLMRAISEAREGSEAAANQLTFGLAQALSTEHPAFTKDGFGLSVWEARVDRGVGMLMRPPARLFADAGLDPGISRAMPVRIDLQLGMMGGAWIPARLIPDLERLLDARLERMAKRLHEAEYDPYSMIGLMLDAVRYASQHGLGLYEALDVIGPGGEAIPGTVVVTSDRKRIPGEIKSRIELAIKPPKKPGLFSRMLGRGGGADDTTETYPGFPTDDPEQSDKA